VAGLSQHGIAEEFPLQGARSIYGATKLSSELLVEEYAAAYDLPAIVNRCGVIAGPWQMGKADQGIVGFWVIRHELEQPLEYIGYGGTGKQVRDVMHVDDLASLVLAQIAVIEQHSGRVFNVGGGRACSVSLKELTALCVEHTGKRVPLSSEPETRQADVPIYLSDARRVQRAFDWAPEHDAHSLVADIARWARDHRDALARALT